MEQVHPQEPEVPEMAVVAATLADPGQAQAPKAVDKKVHVSKTTSERAELMNFLKGINPSTFLSTHQEWHAFVIGFCEVLCPWPPRHKSMHKDLRKQIASEYHYYVFGRALGIIAWLIIAKIIQEAFF